MDHIRSGNTSLRSGTPSGTTLDVSYLKQAVQWGVNLKSAGESFINTKKVKANEEITKMMSKKEFEDNDNGKEKVARANAMMVGVGKGIVNVAKGAKSGDTIMAITGVLG